MLLAAVLLETAVIALLGCKVKLTINHLFIAHKNINT